MAYMNWYDAKLYMERVRTLHGGAACGTEANLVRLGWSRDRFLRLLASMGEKPEIRESMPSTWLT